MQLQFIEPLHHFDPNLWWSQLRNTPVSCIAMSCALRDEVVPEAQVRELWRSAGPFPVHHPDREATAQGTTSDHL